jgi:hypothetical protein
MLQLKNQTPFGAHIAILPDEDGVDSLVVTVKATFSIAPKLDVAPEPVPIRFADEYWGEPGESSLKYAAEVHLAKPSTDVVMVGHAWAPGDKPVARLDVSVAVGNRRRAVRVTGDREWRPGFWFLPARMTSPEPFTKMPLVYERSFGGVHEIEGKKEVLFEPRNPVGKGFVGKRRGGSLKGLPLPNLEDQGHPVRDPKHRPAPAGFAFIPPAWEPRKSFAGTYDRAWQKTRAPYLPKDFDSRFFNAAHPDLVMPGYLAGGEPVEVVNASPSGPLRFRLPRAELTCVVTIAGRPENPPLALETVLIEPDEARLSMLWRGAASCDKRALKVEEIALALGKLEMNGSARA